MIICLDLVTETDGMPRLAFRLFYILEASVKRITTLQIQQKKANNEKIVMLTAYDALSATLAEQAGIDILLVGDSLGMVVLGYDSTVPVSIEDIIHHTKPVVDSTSFAHVVADMPFGSYQAGWKDAMRNAVHIMKSTGASSIKLEGGKRVAKSVEKLVNAGIPVMGHIGLTPQSVNTLGGYKIQGKTPRSAVKLIADAKALEEAGAYAVVLETIPAALSHMITSRLNIPTIGIGAGPYCSGQVQVFHDILGLYKDFNPKHARQFINGSNVLTNAIKEYKVAVEDSNFPTADESFFMEERNIKLINSMMENEPVIKTMQDTSIIQKNE
jgi:3-methyl-2-oxobutanoate hydroxymethyltransferase